MFKMYRIEVDSHFHGGEAPRPWVARIDGTDEKFGLQREFVKPLNDWALASRSWRGRVRGVVATFPLRDGHLYEVSRCRGKPSKRYVAREFSWLASGKMERRTPEEALALAEGNADTASVLRLADAEDRPWVAEITGLGMPRKLGFVVVDGERLYRLRDGHLYEARDIDRRGNERRRLILVDDGEQATITHAEAMSWLAR